MSVDSASLVLALERYCSSLLLASCRCSLCHRLSLWRAFFHGCTRARSFAWLPLHALTTLSLQLPRRRHGLRCSSCPPPSKMFYSLAWTCLSSNIDACLGSFWSHLPQNRLQRLRRCEPLRQSDTICLKNGLVGLSATCCRPGCQLGLIVVLLLALWLEPLDPCMFPPPNFGWQWPPKKVVTYWHVVMHLCRVARRTMLWSVRICRPGLGATTTISDFRPPTTKAFCSCSPCLLAMSGSTTCAGKPWEWLSSRRFCRRKNGPPGGQSFCCMPSTQWMTLCLRSGSRKRLMEEPFHHHSRNKTPVGHSCGAQCLRDLSPSDTTSTRLIGCSVATSKSHAAEQLAGPRCYESRFLSDAVCHLHPSFLSPCVSPLSIVRYLPLIGQPRGAVRRAAAKTFLGHCVSSLCYRQVSAADWTTARSCEARSSRAAQILRFRFFQASRLPWTSASNVCYVFDAAACFFIHVALAMHPVTLSSHASLCFASVAAVLHALAATTCPSQQCFPLLVLSPSGSVWLELIVPSTTRRGTWLMPPRRRPWADEEDDCADADATPPMGLAPRPPLQRREPPFGVFLRAYLAGLGDPTVSRGSMIRIQQVLQTHPHTAILLHQSPLWDVIFHISLYPERKADHVVEYLVAVHNGGLCQSVCLYWLQLLRIECYVDFACPRLWRALFPRCSLPPTRPEWGCKSWGDWCIIRCSNVMLSSSAGADHNFTVEQYSLRHVRSLFRRTAALRIIPVVRHNVGPNVCDHLVRLLPPKIECLWCCRSSMRDPAFVPCTETV